MRGSFRWSGTTILIFTPDRGTPLPYATTYEVTVETTAAAVSGRRLSTPRTFTFTTPTVRLLSTDWYRRNDRVDQPLVMLLRFNQPVRAGDVAAHLTASLERHDWQPPSSSPEELERLRAIDPGALAAFTAKVQATQRVAAEVEQLGFRLTTDWNRERFPASPDLVAFETTSPVMPESWIGLVLDIRLPSPAGPARPSKPQSYTLAGRARILHRRLLVLSRV